MLGTVSRMADLTGRVALVAGGAGAVGEGIVRALLGAGAQVVVPSRNPDRLAELRTRLGEPAGLHGVIGDIGAPGGADGVAAAAVEQAGRLDAAVAAVGGWWQQSDLVDVTPSEWQRVLENNLTTHFLLLRAVLPRLREEQGSSYQFVIGDSAESPVPGASLSTVTAAAVLGLFRAAAAEEHQVRVNALYLAPVLTRNRPTGPAGWLSAEEVGAYAAWLAGDSGAAVRGQVVRPDKNGPG